MISFKERNGLIFLQKDLKHNWHQGGGAINYDNDDDDDDGFDDDDDDDYDVFSKSQRTSNTVANMVGLINYDDDYDNDDDDDYDNNDLF